MCDRRGSVLLVVLVVFFLTVAGLSMIQRLSLESAQRSHVLFLADDSLQRADGLLELQLARFKRGLRTNSMQPLDLPESADESGVWDGRKYDLAWEIVKSAPSATRWRAWVWIRFTEDRPVRTYRYELSLRIPAQVAPRPVIVIAEATDRIAPRSVPARKAALAALLGRKEEDDEAVARLEAWTDALGGGAIPGETPEAFARRAGAGLDPASITLLKRVQSCLRVLDEKSFAVERLSAARALFASVAPLGRRWVDLGRFELAGALSQHAEEADPGARTAELGEALQLAEAGMSPEGDCCAEAMMAWRWGHLKMRVRGDPRDPAVLLSTRRFVVTSLRDRVKGDGFFHRHTDITLKELPGLFEQLWMARIAATVQVNPQRYLLVSLREDGGVPLIHLESPTPVEPMTWTQDGGAVVAANVSDIDAGQWRYGGGNRWVAWNLSLEGLQPVDLEPVRDGYPTTDPGVRWFGISAETSADDRTVLLNGVLLNEVEEARIGIPRGWLVRDGRSISLEIQTETGAYSHSSVFSPRGDLVGVFSDARQNGPAGIYLLNTEDALSSRYAWTWPQDDQDRAGSGTGELFARFPFDSLPEGGAVAGVSWLAFPGAEWLAFTWAQPAGTRVVFYQTLAPRRPGSPLAPMLSNPLPYDPEVCRRIRTMPHVGALVRSPPGYLVGAKGGLHLVPLPGTPAAGRPPPAWPVGLAGRLTEISDVSVPPWGEVAFFAARDGAGPMALYSLDLTSGNARLLLGPGGVISRAREVGRSAVSPVPITRVPDLVPLAM